MFPRPILIGFALVALTGCTTNDNLFLIQSRLSSISNNLEKIAEQPSELRYSLTVCKKVLDRMSYRNTVNEQPIVILNLFDSRKKEGDLYVDVEVQRFLDRYKELALYCETLAEIAD